MAKSAKVTEKEKEAGSGREEMNSAQRRRKLIGMVVSDKMEKTIAVRVERRVRHPFYKKYVVRSKKYLAHDETNEANLGDKVVIVESRPLSTRKRWALQSVVRKAGVAAQMDI